MPKQIWFNYGVSQPFQRASDNYGVSQPFQRASDNYGVSQPFQRASDNLEWSNSTLFYVNIVDFFSIKCYNFPVEKLNFYKVDPEYCDYLRSFDNKIPYIVYPKHNKFFVGVVFSIYGKKYFAPVSSYNKKMKGTFNIYENGEILSSVRFYYMFPVVDGTYEKLNISKEFIGKYKSLVEKEYRYCNLHREEIVELAAKVYNKRLDSYKNTKTKALFDRFMCDYELLERVAENYKK